MADTLSKVPVYCLNGAPALELLSQTSLNRYFKDGVVFTIDPRVIGECEINGYCWKELQYNNIAHGTRWDHENIERIGDRIDKLATVPLEYQGVDLFGASNYDISRNMNHSMRISEMILSTLEGLEPTYFMIAGISSSPYIEAAFLCAAKIKRTPSYFALPLGLYRLSRHVYSICYHVDHILCPGIESVKSLERGGVKGKAAFPRKSDSKGDNNVRPNSATTSVTDKKNVVVALNLWKDSEIFLRELSGLVNDHQDLQFLVQPHPGDSPETLKTIKECLTAQRQAGNIHIVKHLEDDLFRGALALLTPCSFQISLKAFFHNVPVVAYLSEDLQQSEKLDSYRKIADAVFISRSRIELSRILHDLKDKAQTGRVRQKIRAGQKVLKTVCRHYIYSAPARMRSAMDTLWTGELDHKVLCPQFEKSIERKPSARKHIDVLFFASYPILLEACFPVAEKLKQAGYEILFLTDAYNDVAHILSKGFKAEIWGFDRVDFDTENCVRFGQWINENENRFSSNGLSKIEIESFKLNALRILLNAASDADRAVEVLDSYSPGLIVIGDSIISTPLLLTNIGLCREINIVAFEHGLNFPWYLKRTAISFKGCFAALGNYSADELIKYGFDPKRVRVIGLTRPSHLGSSSMQTTRHLKNRIEGRRSVIFATVNTILMPSLFRWTIDFINHVLVKICAELDVVPVIKLHPRDPVAAFTDRIDDPNTIIIQDISFDEDVIKSVCCFISTFSTFLVESVRHGAPVIQLQMEKRFDLHYLADGKSVFAAKSEDEFCMLLKNFCSISKKRLQLDDARKYYEYYLGSEIDENISRMSEFCAELLV